MSEPLDKHDEKDGRVASATDTFFEAAHDDECTEDSELSRTALIVVLVPVILAYFLWFLDLAVVSTATPAITSEFNSLVDVGWYGGAYQLGSSAFTPLTGKLFRAFSIKWTFLVFFLIFEIGSTVCATAPTSAAFIVGRSIAGVGCSGISTGALTIIAAILPGKAQAKVLGIAQGLGQVELAIGPVLGGAFTEYVSWRWCFYINLPIGAVVGILLLLSRIPDPEPKKPAREVLGRTIKSLDLPGFALICPAVIMLLLGLQFGGNEYPWNSSVVIGLLVGSSVTVICFLLWEKSQGDNAMVPLLLLTNRIIWSAAGNLAFVLASILVADFYLAIYFQAVNDDSPLMSGVHLLPTCLSIVLFTIISGIMIEKLGYYLPWTVTGSAISAIGYGLLSLLSPTTRVAEWIGYQLLYGVGSGCTVVAGYVAVQNLVSTAQVPTAMAIVIFFQGLGGAISLIAANAVFSNSLRSLLSTKVEQIGVTPEAIIAAGARGLRQLIPDNGRLTIVLQAYTDSIDKVMYLGIGVACAAFAFAWGLGFKDIRKKEITHKAQAAELGVAKDAHGNGTAV